MMIKILQARIVNDSSLLPRCYEPKGSFPLFFLGIREVVVISLLLVRANVHGKAEGHSASEPGVRSGYALMRECLTLSNTLEAWKSPRDTGRRVPEVGYRVETEKT